MIRTSNDRSLQPEAVLANLVEEITERIEAGERFNIEEYVARYPGLADQLRQLVPALQALDELGLSAASSLRRRSDGLLATPSGELGDFRILREIGRGGMGVVYEAEQISLGRRVALKVLPFAAMLDKQHMARFKNEARAAGTLNHPNIVAIYSVGCERGVHYYAMQLIEGQNLAQWVHRLRSRQSNDPRARESIHIPLDDVEDDAPRASFDQTASFSPSDPLVSPGDPDTQPMARRSTVPVSGTSEYYRAIAQLGIQAAEALDHAHQNGILHRDVKPANLMVDDAGKLWVTDFGLARLETDVGMTMTGDLVGTLRYMSPEQALAKRVVVDHRSDVYSLGATLYELLTLQPPFDGDDRQELLRRIAFDEPKKPRQLNGRIPQDLETIVLKAIEKHPDQRYATAADLAADLRRYLDHEPIMAKPQTWREQAVKWCRRHPAVVSAVVLILTITTVFATISTLLIAQAYRRESAQRIAAEASERQAQTNARQAEAIASFLVRAFQSPDPWRDGHSITVAEILKRAEENLDSDLGDAPLVRVALLTAIGKARLSLGMNMDAIGPLTDAYDLRTTHLGRSHADTQDSLALLASAYGNIDPRKAARLWEQVVRLRQDAVGDTHPKTIEAMDGLARLYGLLGRRDEALKLLTRIAEARRVALGPDDPDTILALSDLAIAKGHPTHAIWAGFGDESEFLAYAASDSFPDDLLRLLEQAVAQKERKHGDSHPESLFFKRRLALAYCGAGRYVDAIALYKEGLSAGRERFGADHPWSVEGVWHLRTAIKAQVLAHRRAGRLTDADRCADRAIADYLEEGCYATAVDLVGLGSADQLDTVIERAVTDDHRRLPMGIDMLVMGELRLLAGQHEAALPAIDAAMDRDHRSFFHGVRGEALFAQGNTDAARAAFLRALHPQAREDGTFESPENGTEPVSDWQSKLERQGATPDQLKSAYFLDLITDAEFAEALEVDPSMAPFPWYYFGRRKDYEGDKAAAMAAYRRCIELAKGEPERSISVKARWRLKKLGQMPSTN